uniref:Uncharacterized protein n=1 Tax=Avena sativa TaxID=4498 RepID=A0ACD5U5S0_AVESA
MYSAMSPSPIAAASLGQVYKARLKSSGQLVAVKVQRPGIEDAIGRDFYLLRGLGFLINKYVDIITTDAVALIDEFACRVFQELNYVQEGQNARRFKKLYADKQDILVPDIFWDYTSAKVLTMEWIEGVKLNQQAAIEGQGLKVLDLVNIGIQCSLRQLLEYGYFHADPHPGGPFKLSDVEREQMMELRGRVLRIWGLLRSSDSFDPSLLQPIVQVLQEPEARVFGSRVAGGVTQRLAARLLQQLLRIPPAPVPRSS